MAMDETRRRTGRRAETEKLGPDELRTITVSPRVNRREARQLDEWCKPLRMSRGEYMRCVTFGTVPRSIPAINQQAWSQLARLSGNLNQYQAAINVGKATGYPPELLAEIVGLVEGLRRDLIDASAHLGADDDEDDAE